MRIRLTALCLGALGTLAFACTSSTNPYAEDSEYCTAYAQAICQIGTTSCQFSVTSCETFQENTCLTNATTAKRTRVYTPANVQACINAVNAAYGGSPSSISASTLLNINSVCAQVFVGTAATNGPCSTSYDCAVSSEICATNPGQTAQCAVPTPKSLGLDCLDPGDECPSGAICSSTGLPPSQGGTYGTCVAGTPPSAIGGNCCSTADCASGLYCDEYTDSTVPSPTCVSQLNGFGRGGLDCLGIAGSTTMGCPSSSSSGADAGSGSGADSGGSDAPNGG